MVQLQEKVKIENARVNDISEILDMIEDEKFKEDGSGSLLAVTPIDLSLRIQRGNAFAAYNGNELVGFASLVEYDGVAEMATVYVKPEMRAMGISSQLKDMVVERAKERGYEVLFAYTNDAALPKFQSWGFALTESTPEKLSNYCQNCPKYNVSCNERPVALELYPKA